LMSAAEETGVASRAIAILHSSVPVGRVDVSTQDGDRPRS
jgi:hypothetical protein